MQTHRVIPTKHNHVNGKEQYFIIILLDYDNNTDNKHIIKISKAQYLKIKKEYDSQYKNIKLAQ